MAQREVALERGSLQRDRVSVTGLVSGVSNVTGIGSSIFVSLETIGGSTTGIVSVFAPLELVPDVSVGVLNKKIYPSGGSD